MSTIRTYPAHAPRIGIDPAINRAIRTVGTAGIGTAWATIRVCLERYRYRHELRRLLRVGPHMIADIGLSRGQARNEADKPFWRP